jgi:molecular chaperone HtpG
MTNSVIIGKNIIEILTTGMYHNPLVIFREYIQNSIDAINEAVNRKILDDISEGDVQVTVDKEKRTVSFEDNGIGVPSEKAFRILTSIAASSKDRTKNLGFRGIGRLAGLAYCDDLLIETSTKGEASKTVLKWDGKKLREIIGDKSDNKLASDVVEAITSLSVGLLEREDAHYFKVKLLNVKNDKLLDVESVKRYLRMVAPVKFYHPTFMFSHDIVKGLVDRGVKCDGYKVFVNTTELFKAYQNNVYQEDKTHKKRIDEIIGTEFFELYSKDNQLLAVCWYALTKNMQLIPVFNEAWGIRFRKGNIQVGDEFTLQRFFRENRFHRYFFGEIHVVHDELFPNGQRDYFDECDLLSEFEDQVQALTSKLHSICRKASEWNTAEKFVEVCAAEIESYEKTVKSEEFYSPEHEEEEKAKLLKLREDAEKAEKKLKRLEELTEEDEVLKRFVDYRLNNKPNNTRKLKENCDSDPQPKNGNKKYKANKLSRLNKREQRLVGEIYEVIRTILPPDLQKVLIYKIEEKFGLSRSCE